MPEEFINKDFLDKIKCECGQYIMRTRMSNHLHSLIHEKLMLGYKINMTQKTDINSFNCHICDKKYLNKFKYRHENSVKHKNNLCKHI